MSEWQTDSEGLLHIISSDENMNLKVELYEINGKRGIKITQIAYVDSFTYGTNTIEVVADLRGRNLEAFLEQVNRKMRLSEL